MTQSCVHVQEDSSFKLGQSCIVTLAVGNHISRVSKAEWAKMEQAEKNAMPARYSLHAGRQHK